MTLSTRRAYYSLIEQIRFMETQIAKLDDAISEKARTLAPQLMSIPDVSEKIAGDILAELGDVRKFKNSSAVVRFAGLNPISRESGVSVRGESHINKEGSPYLRRALFMVAIQQMRQDNFLNDFYRKKRAEVKSNSCALTALSRKLLVVIYAMLLSGEDFDPGRG